MNEVRNMFTLQTVPVLVNEDSPRPQLARRLLWFQIFMIGASATIGLGIFIRIGEVLSVSGPAGTILAFGLVGLVSIAVMDGVAEMVELWPVSNPFLEFVSAFVDEDLGKVVGFAYWYTYAMGFQSLLNAAGGLITIWVDNRARLQLYQRIFFYFVSPLILFCLNYMGVFWVGMVETVLGIAKITFLIAAFFLTLAVDYGGVGSNPQTTKTSCIDDGFRANPIIANSRFEAFLVAVPTAAFAFIGVETVAITAYEAKSKKHVKLPARLIAWCMTGLYLLSVCGSVLSVSWQDPRLPTLYRGQEPNPQENIRCRGARALSEFPEKDLNKPPIVIALENVGSRVGRDALTGCLIFVVLSAANAALYVASRTIFGLTKDIDKDAGPFSWVLSWLGFVTKGRGHHGAAGATFGQIPAGALIFSVLIFYWAPFITNGQVLDVLSAMGTVGCLLVWASQALAYIRFDHLRRKYKTIRPYAREKKTPGQPFYAWFALISCLVIVFILNTASWWNGKHIYPARWLQVYIGPLVLLVLYIALKLLRLRRSRPQYGDGEKEQFFAALRDLERKARETVNNRVSMEDLHDSEIEGPSYMLDGGPRNERDQNGYPIPHGGSEHDLVEEPKGQLQTNVSPGPEALTEQEWLEAVNRL